MDLIQEHDARLIYITIQHKGVVLTIIIWGFILPKAVRGIGKKKI